jgi:hypothetical protein
MATPSLIGKKAPAKAPAKASAPAEEMRWWRVKEDRMVPRRGSGAFMLKKGKELSTPGSYTLREMEAAGVELIEISEPSWYTEQQAIAREKHQSMLDEGHDVGPVPPPHVPTVVKAAPPNAPTS